MRLSHGAVEVEIGLDPLAITVRRGGRRLVRDLSVHLLDGVVGDQFVQWTEGVLAHEDLEDPVRPRAAQAEATATATARA